jgi:hypothetical protein
LLNNQGRTVAKLLQIKPGPIMGVIQEKVIEWQLQRENEECERWITTELWNIINIDSNVDKLQQKQIKKRKQEAKKS